MVLSVRLKRLAKERERFPSDSSEFWVNFKDADLRYFTAYITGPEDSVYAQKLIKLRFDIPDQYPFEPPKVTFIQHTGDRLHPNLYTEGKVCLSILGTWAGPGWSQSMGVESVLRTVRSLLDQQPYLHEPHGRDRPEFNAYVRHHGWRWLLLDYIENERDMDAMGWLDGYLRTHGKGMIAELERQKLQATRSTVVMANPYCPRQRHVVDYDRLLGDLKVKIARAFEALNDARVVETVIRPMAGSTPMEAATVKRKLPFEAEQAQAKVEMPVKKQRVVVDLEDSSSNPLATPALQPRPKQRTEVVDLTDD